MCLDVSSHDLHFCFTLHRRYWQKAFVNLSALLQTKLPVQLKLVTLEMGMVTVLSVFILLERNDSSMRDGRVLVSSTIN